MTTIGALLKRHPLLSYFAIASLISWSGIIIAVGLGPGGFSATPQQFQMAVPFAVPAKCLWGRLVSYNGRFPTGVCLKA